MSKLTGSFEISFEQNDAFAELSGDYNPLHVDPVYSRRLQFGKPVIHGIHHLLRACENVFQQCPDFSPFQFTKLNATFPNPVSVGELIEYEAQLAEDANSVVVTSRSGNKTILSLRLAKSEQKDEDRIAVSDSIPAREEAIDQNFPPAHSQGSCELSLNRDLASRLFPTLTEFCLPGQLAQILASTRVVGMKCPGLHSIYSRIQLSFNSGLYPELEQALDYAEKFKDARVHIMKMAVKSIGVEGILDTFFRPAPVDQPGFAVIKRQFNEQIFAGQHALVIGGSRGVGECTVKLLLAGGADVVLSYNKGKADAERIAQEINAESCPGTFKILQMDVCQFDPESALCFSGDRLPTHIYYFASPHIESNRSSEWNAKLHEKFCLFYLQSFSEMVNFYAKKLSDTDKLTILYPSTIFIEQPETGYAEYAVAKAGGEFVSSVSKTFSAVNVYATSIASYVN